MEFRTIVNIPQPDSNIEPTDNILFVGSCFAENIGRRFRDNGFKCTVNPYGTMYNPASVLHTVQRIVSEGAVFDKVIMTLGTNHVYILKETGEIVDNCQKRPQRLFEERQLSIEECEEYLWRAIEVLEGANPKVDVLITVSPIRYAKYGYHESQLSKATLLLAVNNIVNSSKDVSGVGYFPSYEIINDELRDYRFYASDMLHPSEQAVDYIYERFSEVYFSKSAKQMVSEWKPIQAALNHRPFNPEDEEYKKFLAKAKQDEELFRIKWWKTE